MSNPEPVDRIVSQPKEPDPLTMTTRSSNQNAASNAQPELHKPPVFVFLLPLIIIMAYAYFMF